MVRRGSKGWAGAYLKDAPPTGAGSVVCHGDVIHHQLRTPGDVDPSAILGCVTQQLGVDNGQLSYVVGSNTASLCTLVGVALGVVHVQGGAVCTTHTAVFSFSVTNNIS